MRISEPNNKLPLGQHAALLTSQSHCIAAVLHLDPLVHSDLHVKVKIRDCKEGFGRLLITVNNA